MNALCTMQGVNGDDGRPGAPGKDGRPVGSHTLTLHLSVITIHFHYIPAVRGSVAMRVPKDLGDLQ